jgi:hypothetical protein
MSGSFALGLEVNDPHGKYDGVGNFTITNFFSFPSGAWNEDKTGLQTDLPTDIWETTL